MFILYALRSFHFLLKEYFSSCLPGHDKAGGCPADAVSVAKSNGKKVRCALTFKKSLSPWEICVRMNNTWKLKSRKKERKKESPDTLCPPLSSSTDVPQPSLQCSHLPHPSHNCTLGDWADGARAKATICRRLEINDSPKPSGSSSHSTASAGAVTGPPNLLLFLKSMCETPASHAGVCRGERSRVDLVGEAQPFTQGSGQVEHRGETSCLPSD